MNTLRNFAALALLAIAAISPARAEQAAEATRTPVDADGGPADGASLDDVRKLLEDKPELAALAGGGQEQAIVDALKEQVSNAGGEKAIADALKQHLDDAGGEQAVGDALNAYLSKHPLKDGQDISDLARDAKQKAIAKALKARFSKRP